MRGGGTGAGGKDFMFLNYITNQNISRILGSLPSLSIVRGEEPTKKKESKPPILSDFDARYLGALDDFDELEDIEPGCLTLSNSGRTLFTLNMNSSIFKFVFKERR